MGVENELFLLFFRKYLDVEDRELMTVWNREAAIEIGPRIKNISTDLGTSAQRK